MKKKINNLSLELNKKSLDKMFNRDYIYTIDTVFAKYMELLTKYNHLVKRVSHKQKRLMTDPQDDSSRKHLQITIDKMQKDIQDVRECLEQYTEMVIKLYEMCQNNQTETYFLKRLGRLFQVNDEHIKFYLYPLINIIDKHLTSDKQSNQTKLLIFLCSKIRNLDFINNVLKREYDARCQDKDFPLCYTMTMDYILKLLLQSNNLVDQDYYIRVLNLMFKWDRYNFLDENKLYCILKLKTVDDNKTVKTIIRKYDKKEITEDQLAASYGINLGLKNYQKDMPSNTSRCNFMRQEMVTIDNAQSGCLDDGFYLTFNKNGTYTVYIHVIDASSYVKYNSDTFNIAIKQGESFYLPNQVVQMLPDDLAYNSCSFKGSHPHNAITLIARFDNNFDLIPKSISILPSRVIPRYNLTYDDVDYQLEYGSSDYEHDRMMEHLALIALKMADGETCKNKYRCLENIVSEKCYPESFYTDIPVSANIVNELMVFYNTEVAKYMYKNNLPYIYCNNTFNGGSSFEKEKDQIMAFMSHMNMDSRAILSILQNSYNHSYYSVTSDGHQGIGSDYYSHSCSPARRGVDMLGQYVINDLVFKRHYDEDDISKWFAILKEYCQYFNEKKLINDRFTEEYNCLYRRLLIKK